MPYSAARQREFCGDMIGFRAVSAGHLPTPTDEDFHVDDDLSTPLIHAVYCTYAIKTRWLPLVFAYLPITFTGNRGRIPVYVSYVVYDLYIFNMINTNEAWFCRIPRFEMLVTKKFLIRHTLSLSFSETQCCTNKIVQ